MVYNTYVELVDRLRLDYPDITFAPCGDAISPHWNYTEHTIYYDAGEAVTLHELGHAILNHKKYGQDVELIKLERAAWDKALELAPRYGVKITEDDVEAALDSYRDWLHRRSCCPKCGQVGLQSAATHCYKCYNCGATWIASAGKVKRLRRKVIPSKKTKH